MSRHRIGIDIGGTFTDGVAFDIDSGELIRAKVSTTTSDQSEGTLGVFREFGIAAGDVEGFHHGATVGVNAVLTRKGAKTGLLCTRGFRDLLDIGRLERPYDDPLYDPNWMRPHQERPLVERRYRREISERMLESSVVHEELDEDWARKEIEFLAREGVESVAICLINSYAGPEHEQRLRELVAEEMPGAYVQLSRVHPVAGEYKRTFTVVLDAYVGPAVNHYLTNLRRLFAEEGLQTDIQMMQMNGGLRTLDRTIEEFPAYTMSSGPVAGVLGAEYYARSALQTDKLVCVDIGGTSTDIGFISDGAALLTDDWEVDQGMPLGVPTVDVQSIGAGGGSLIRVDDLGTLRVGPESAGARPGPVAYGLGGTEPTLTDAYLALGLVRPKLFMGGRMELDAGASRNALARVGERIEMDALELAVAAYDLVNRDIVNATRKQAFDHAFDLREYSLFAYGGAGPLHSVAAARALEMDQVVIPYFPGGFSAFGMVTSRPRVERSTSPMRPLDEYGFESLATDFAELEEACHEDLLSQGVSAEESEVERFAYVMYTGQSWDNRLPLKSGPFDEAAIAQLREDTHAYYEAVYGFSARELDIVVTTLAVVGQGPSPEIRLPRIDAGGGRPSEDSVAIRGEIRSGGRDWPDTPFYARPVLRAGDVVEGPAIIDDELGTIFVDPGARATVDGFGTISINW